MVLTKAEKQRRYRERCKATRTPEELEEMRRKNRIRVQRYRERKRHLAQTALPDAPLAAALLEIPPPPPPRRQRVAPAGTPPGPAVPVLPARPSQAPAPRGFLPTPAASPTALAAAPAVPAAAEPAAAATPNRSPGKDGVFEDVCSSQQLVDHAVSMVASYHGKHSGSLVATAASPASSDASAPTLRTPPPPPPKRLRLRWVARTGRAG